MSEDKLNRLINLVKLNNKSNVLEIVCCKAEFLIKLAELYGIQGMGVDISPFCTAEAKEKLKNRCPNAKIKFIEMNGAYCKHSENNYFLILLCILARNGFLMDKKTL